MKLELLLYNNVFIFIDVRNMELPISVIVSIPYDSGLNVDSMSTSGP